MYAVLSASIRCILAVATFALIVGVLTPESNASKNICSNAVCAVILLLKFSVSLKLIVVLSMIKVLVALPSICGLIVLPTILTSLNTVLVDVLSNVIVLAFALVEPITSVELSTTTSVVPMSCVPVKLIILKVVVLVDCTKLIVVPSIIRVCPELGITGSVTEAVVSIGSFGFVRPLVPSGSNTSHTLPAYITRSLYLYAVLLSHCSISFQLPSKLYASFTSVGNCTKSFLFNTR